MSKTIGIIMIILFLVVGGIAYLNYDRLNQIQQDLAEKETLLQDSEQLLKQQESSITELQEKIKQNISVEEEKTPVKELILAEEKFEQQVVQFQEELQKIEQKLEETLRQNSQKNQDIAQLSQEKSTIETLLREKEEQWQAKENENEKTISVLREDIGNYQADTRQVKEKMSDLETYLSSELSKRKDLEEKIVQYEQDIGLLEEKLALEQENEIQVQQISQLQSNREQLKKQLEQKDTSIDKIEKESQLLHSQLVQYQGKIEELQNRIVQTEEQKSVINEIQDSLAHLKEEKNQIEVLLQQKEDSWLAREEQNQQTIAQLKTEVQNYETNLRQIGQEMLALRGDLDQELSLKQNLQEEINQFTAEVSTKRKEDATLATQVSQMKQEMKILEQLLTEKEEKWNKENQENQQLISYLEKQLEKYQNEMKVFKIDSGLLKKEIAAQVEVQQEIIARIKDREEQVSVLTSQIEGHVKKIKDYEKTVAELKEQLQPGENIDYDRQQELMNHLLSLVKERDALQGNIEGFRVQINKLDFEIVQLQQKITVLEKEEEKQYYEVKRGDSLWAIARGRYEQGIAWIKIFKANQDLIENPDLIYPYQQFIIPE